MFLVRAHDSLTDVLSIHRACEGHGRDLDVAVEHFGVVYEAGGDGVGEDDGHDESLTLDRSGGRHHRVLQR